MGAIETNANLFREIQARCRDLTVNQWLGEFDPHTRSQIWGQHRGAVLLCKQNVYKGSIPWVSTKLVGVWCNW